MWARAEFIQPCSSVGLDQCWKLIHFGCCPVFILFQGWRLGNIGVLGFYVAVFVFSQGWRLGSIQPNAPVLSLVPATSGSIVVCNKHRWYCFSIGGKPVRDHVFVGLVATTRLGYLHIRAQHELTTCYTSLIKLLFGKWKTETGNIMAQRVHILCMHTWLESENYSDKNREQKQYKDAKFAFLVS